MSEETVKLTTENTCLNQEVHCENLGKKIKSLNELDQGHLHINHLQQINSGSYKLIFKKTWEECYRPFTSTQSVICLKLKAALSYKLFLNIISPRKA